MRAANVTWRGIDTADVKEMDFSPDELETYRLHEGDLLLSEASGSPSEVGKPAMWQNQIPDCCFQNTLIRVRARAPTLAPFLHLHFLRDAMTGRFAAASRGVGIHHLGGDTLVNWCVDLPPVEEQARIREAVDSYLSRLDAAVESLTQAQAKLKAYRASVLKAAVEGRLVPTEAELAKADGRSYEPADKLLERILVERRRAWEERQLADMKAKGKVPKDDKWKANYPEPAGTDSPAPGPLPEGWCWTTTDAVGDILLGRRRAPEYVGTHRKYLRVANIKDDDIDFGHLEEMPFDDREFEKYRLENGDILLSEGQSLDRVGQSAIYRGNTEPLCFQATLHRFRPAWGGPKSEYAQIVFRSNVKTGVFMRLASITTNIAHLTLSKLKAAPFPLAPEPEQDRLARECDRLMSLADAAERQVETSLRRCARLRQAILKAAFEGRLVDQDPNDEPASELLARLRATPEPASKPKRGRKPKKTA